MKYLEDGVKTILLAVDFSQPTQRAFDAAIRAARTFGAALIILHANEEDSLFGGHSSEELTNFLDDIVRRRTDWMSTFEQQAAELGVRARSILRDGDPAETILQVAEETDADLIVIGTQGARGLVSVLPGSVAKKVLRGADRPIMVISRMAGVAPAESGGSFERIVYPTDFSEASRAGLRVAELLVDKTDAALTLVNVVRLPRIIPSLPGEPPIMLPDRAVEHLQENFEKQMEELVAELPGDEIDSVVAVNADPAGGICDIASQSGVDLIVIARHSKHGAGSMVFGHTAEKVVKTAPVPVLLFNPRVD